jgi:L-aminopeptidase/D-esterase-like protein
VILPRAPDEIQSKPVYAAMHTLNGIGELTGAHQIQEYGWINTVSSFQSAETNLTFLMRFFLRSL